MLNSLFYLVNCNQGKFKSEKQAKFFMDKYDGLFSISQTYYKNNYSWDFSFNEDGIQLVTKTTAKAGVTVYWENTPEHFAKLAKKAEAKEIAKKDEAIIHFNSCYAYTKPILDQLFKEYDILSNDKLMKENNLSDSLVEHLKKEKQKRINNEMSLYQEAIKWTVKYI